MSDPKPMDPKRLANLRASLGWSPYFDELLGAHDYHVKRAEVTRLKAENARLRARVRIEAEDIRRAGVTRAKCEAYVLARLGEPLVDVFPDDPRTWPTAIDSVIICIADDPDDLAERWRILDEMASMEVSGG